MGRASGSTQATARDTIRLLPAPVQLAILNPIGFILLELGAATQKLGAPPRRTEPCDEPPCFLHARDPCLPLPLSTLADSGQPSKCALVKKIARNLAFNPVIATTVLGLAFGFAFGPPTGVFKQLLDQVVRSSTLRAGGREGGTLRGPVLTRWPWQGSAFAMCALFSLGLSIYGKVRRQAAGSRAITLPTALPAP